MKIEIKNLTKVLGGNTVVDNVNITMESGTVYGLCGYNGCGKTMLMRLIAGLIIPTKGSVSYDGKTLGKQLDFPPSIGILIENPAFLDSRSGFDNLKLLASIKGKVDKKTIASSIRKVGLDPDDKKKFRKYSLGMKQRLAIAQAIMEKPSVIMLDEPTNGLDNEGVALVSHLLAEERDRGTIILIASHNKDDVFILCDYVYRMESGRLIKG